jgi:F0F1-type ATP synthase epsilon subunit
MSFSLSVHSLSTGINLITNVYKLSFLSEIGQHEILPNHESFFTLLEPSTLTYYTTNGGVDIRILDFGFLTFELNVCNVYVGV